MISILIPNFNKSKFLVQTLDSVLAQEYEDWECIVVDDHSTDNSYEILQTYQKRDERFKIFRRPDSTPKGANYCRNLAFSYSKGDFIQWFDSDDIMYPWYLKDKVEYLESHKEVPFVVSKGELIFDENFEGSKKFGQNFYSDDPIEDYLKFKILFFSPGPLFRRPVMEESGLFNVKLQRHQEWELFFRVVLNHSKWGCIDKVSFGYLIHNNSITSRFQEKKKIVESELILFQVILGLPVNKYKSKVSKKTRVKIALKYWMVATYNFRLLFSMRYFFSTLRELARS